MPIYKYYTAQGCLAQGFTVVGFCIHNYNSRNIISWFLLPLCSNLTATLEQNHCQQNGIINSHTKKIKDDFIHYLTPLCNVIMYQAGLKPILRRRWKKCCTYSHAETIFFLIKQYKRSQIFFITYQKFRAGLLCFVKVK